MKILAVLVVLLLMPEGAMAARWEVGSKPIPVWDFSADYWRPAVQGAVDDFNANLPPAVPRLAYSPMGHLPCESLPPSGKKGGITVCTPDVPIGNTTHATIIHGRIVRARITLIPVDNWQRVISSEWGRVACHELTHAVLRTPDDPSYPHLNESCVQGALDHLGPWDIAFAAQAYNHDSGPRHGAGRQHHRAKRGGA